MVGLGGGVELRGYNKEAEGEKERLFRIMEEVTLFFSNALSERKDALEYLRARGLEEKTIIDFRLGYAKDEWRSLSEHLQRKGFNLEEIEKAGLVKKGDDGKSFYDRFRGRIIFPIADTSGRIIAFSGRLFPDAAGGLDNRGESSSGGLSSVASKGPKYLNSPD